MCPEIKVSENHDYKIFPKVSEFDVGSNFGLAKRNFQNWVMFLLFGESYTVKNETHKLKYRKWRNIIYAVRISNVS